MVIDSLGGDLGAYFCVSCRCGFCTGRTQARQPDGA
nr:MAG TPA: hypothetical protein [Caudoviricetes sp.]